MTSSDVIVVGDGIIGSAIAHELVHAGLRVIRLGAPGGRGDSASLAAGAMLGAFAEVVAHKNTRRDQEETAFRVRSSDIYDGWLASIGSTNGHQVRVSRGTFVIANTFSRDDVRNLNAIEAQLRLYNVPYESVEESDIAGYRPNQRYLPRKALWLPREGFVDPSLILESLDVALQSSSRFLSVAAYAQSLVVTAGRVSGVQLRDGTILNSGAVVLAAGVGTQLLVEELTEDARPTIPRLMPGKGTALLLQTAEQFPYVLRSPNRNFACGLHIVPRSSGTIYVGATNRTACCPGTAPGASVEEVHDLLYQAVHEFNTALDSAVIQGIRVGRRPICVDGYPLVGKTSCPGLLLATGTYRNGVLMAPLIARIIAAETLDNNPREVNPFSPMSREVKADVLESDELFTRGAEGIVSFIPSPHGSLPYKRAEEMAAFIDTLLKMAFRSGPKHESLRREAQALIATQPMEETFAQLFFLLGERSSSGD